MVANQVVAPYWEIFGNPIIDDYTIKYEYTEIEETNVNVSQRLNCNFILKDAEYGIFQSYSYLYAKVRIT
jgi:hypothetical protein